MSRCGNCGGLAYRFGTSYLQCMKVAGNLSRRDSARDGCERWTLKQKEEAYNRKRDGWNAMAAARQHRERVIEQTGRDPYTGEEVET